MSGVILGASAMFVALASSASSASAAIIEVHLKDQNFNPKIVSAKAGDTVVFHNDDRVLHSVLLPDNEALLAQHFIEPHASWPIGSISTRRLWPRGASKSNCSAADFVCSPGAGSPPICTAFRAGCYRFTS